MKKTRAAEPLTPRRREQSSPCKREPAVRLASFAALVILIFVSQPSAAASTPTKPYGKSQLEVILEDRPQLAAVLMERVEVRNWLVEELGRENPRPLWDPSEPVSGRAAEHEYPSGTGKVPRGTALIRVSSASPGWDQLAGLLFELHNLRRSASFEEIHQQALRGRIGKSEYVERLLQQEFAALQATREYLNEHLTGVPDAARDGSTLFGQILDTEDTLDAHLEKYSQDGNDLRSHFEQLYEREVAPRVRRTDNTGGR
ncbi:MAG TPA: hypothetical protein VHG33_09145 [Woeseiaceae bacterium]|nr:hypothetical protein [Woeseiaceae bacterium]